MNIVPGPAYARPLTSIYIPNSAVPAQVDDSWVDANAPIDPAGNYSSLTIEGVVRGYICGFAQVFHNGRFTPGMQFQIEGHPWGWMGDYSNKDFNLQGILKQLKSNMFYAMDSMKGSSWLVLGQSSDDISNTKDPGYFGQLFSHIGGLGSSDITKSTYAELAAGAWGYDGTPQFFHKFYGIIFVFNSHTTVNAQLISVMRDAIRTGTRFILLQHYHTAHAIINDLLYGLGIVSGNAGNRYVATTRNALAQERQRHKDHFTWYGINNSLHSHKSLDMSAVYTIHSMDGQIYPEVHKSLGNWQKIFNGSYAYPDDIIKAKQSHFFRERCCLEPGDIFESTFQIQQYPYKPDDWLQGLQKGTHILDWREEDRHQSEHDRQELRVRSSTSSQGFQYKPKAHVLIMVPTNVSTASMFNDPATAGKWGPNEWSYDQTSDTVKGLHNTGWSGAFNRDHLELTDYNFETQLGVFGRGGDNDCIGLMFRIQLGPDGRLLRAYYLVMDMHDDAGQGIRGLKLYKTKTGTANWAGDVHFIEPGTEQVGHSAIHLKDLDTAGWREGVWDKFRVECLGTRIRIWRNGVNICGFHDEDPEMAKGAFGPMNYSQEGCSFRNFQYFPSEDLFLEGNEATASISDGAVSEETKTPVTQITTEQIMAGKIAEAIALEKQKPGRSGILTFVESYGAVSLDPKVAVVTDPYGQSPIYAYGLPGLVFNSESWAKYKGITYNGQTGYNILTLNRTTKEVVDFRTYNPSGYPEGHPTGVSEAGKLAQYLNSLSEEMAVVIFTGSKLRNNRMTAGMDAAMYKVGASSEKFGSGKMSDTAAYIDNIVHQEQVVQDGAVVRYKGNVDHTVRFNFTIATAEGAQWNGAGRGSVLTPGVAAAGGYFQKTNESNHGDLHGTLNYNAWPLLFEGRPAGSVTMSFQWGGSIHSANLVQNPTSANGWVGMIDVYTPAAGEQYIDLTVMTKVVFNAADVVIGTIKTADPANYIHIGRPNLGEGGGYVELLKSGVDSEGKTYLEARYKWGREDSIYLTNGELEHVRYLELKQFQELRYTKKMENVWAESFAGFYGKGYIEDVRFKKLPMHHYDDFYVHVQHPCIHMENIPDFTVNDISFRECNSTTSYVDTTPVRRIIDDEKDRVYLAAYEGIRGKVVLDSNIEGFLNRSWTAQPHVRKTQMSNALNWLSNTSKTKKILVVGDSRHPNFNVKTVKSGTEAGKSGFGTDFPDWLRSTGWEVDIHYWDEVVLYPSMASFLDQYRVVVYFGSFPNGSILQYIPDSAVSALLLAVSNGLGLYLGTVNGDYSESINKVAVNYNSSFTGVHDNGIADIEVSISRYPDHPIYSGLTGTYEITDPNFGAALEIARTTELEQGRETREVMFTVSASEPVQGDPVTLKVQTRNGTAMALSESNSVKYVMHDPFNNPFNAYLEDGQARVVFDGGFTKYYNSTFELDFPRTSSDPICNSNIKIFTRNLLNWLNPKGRPKRVLLIGDKDERHDPEYINFIVKQTSHWSGFGGPFPSHMRNLGWQVDVQYWWELGANPSPTVFDQYAVVIYMSSQHLRLGHPELPETWAKSLQSSVKRGTGLFLITDDVFNGYSYNVNGNVIANLFYAGFHGYVDREYVDIDASRVSFGDHPLIHEMGGRMKAYASEGIITSDGTFGDKQDYIPKEMELTFTSGEQHKQVPVTIICDNDPEADEDFFLVLSDISRGNIIKTEGRAVILDDDAKPFGYESKAGGDGVHWDSHRYRENFTGMFVFEFETWPVPRDQAPGYDDPDWIAGGGGGANDRIDIFRDGLHMGSSPFGTAAYYDKHQPVFQTLPLVDRVSRVFIPHYAELGHSPIYEARVQGPGHATSWEYYTTEERVLSIPRTVKFDDRFTNRIVMHKMPHAGNVRVEVRGGGTVQIRRQGQVLATIAGAGSMTAALNFAEFPYVEIYGTSRGLDYDISMI